MDAYLDGQSRLFLDFPDDDFSVTGRGDNRRRPDPSEDEIAELCAQIRATWTDEEARLRMGFADFQKGRL